MTDTAFVRYPHAARPRVDLDTAVVLDHALVSLADHRFMAALDAPSSCTYWPASSLRRRHGWANKVATAREGGGFMTTIGRQHAGPHRNGGPPALREGALGALTRTTSGN